MQDDTYLLLRQDEIQGGLEAAAPAFLTAGCKLNLRKCSIYSPGDCNVSTSGINRVQSLPLVMKQPLGERVQDGGAWAMHFDPSAVHKLCTRRESLMQRLQDLQTAGLSTQLAFCLARTATAGDAVYLQQCQPLTIHQQECMDSIS